MVTLKHRRVFRPKTLIIPRKIVSFSVTYRYLGGGERRRIGNEWGRVRGLYSNVGGLMGLMATYLERLRRSMRSRFQIFNPPPPQHKHYLHEKKWWWGEGGRNPSRDSNLCFLDENSMLTAHGHSNLHFSRNFLEPRGLKLFFCFTALYSTTTCTGSPRMVSNSMSCFI